jgi:hypothetical protein
MIEQKNAIERQSKQQRRTVDGGERCAEPSTIHVSDMADHMQLPSRSRKRTFVSTFS